MTPNGCIGTNLITYCYLFDQKKWFQYLYQKIVLCIWPFLTAVFSFLFPTLQQLHLKHLIASQVPSETVFSLFYIERFYSIIPPNTFNNYLKNITFGYFCQIYFHFTLLSLSYNNLFLYPCSLCVIL